MKNMGWILGKRPFLDAQVGKLTRKEKNLERAIQAKCYDCMGFYEDGLEDCKCPTCPLYPWMPYKEKKENVKCQ